MFSSNSKVELENKLGNSMLVEGTQNGYIKTVLQNTADLLRLAVLTPLQKSIEGIREFKEIESKEFRAAIAKLSTQHSDEARGYGGVLRNEFKDSKEITENLDHVKVLLNKLDSTIANIQKIKQIDQLAQAIKVIVDLGIAYVDFLPGLHTPRFKEIYDLIWPSPEEQKSRLSPEECGLPKQSALTFGIAKGSSDFISQSDDKENRGYRAGKSEFFEINVEGRLRLLAKQYDQIFQKEVKENREHKLDLFLQEIKKYYGSQLVNEFKKNAGDASQNINFALLAKRLEPSALRLARADEMPLVASVSGTTARLLVAVEDLRGFDTNGEFDPDKAQVMANCIMGFFIRGGHHSVFEVGESYNRLLDYILLNPERTPAEFTRLKEYSRERGEPVEMNISHYFRSGDYRSFLNKAYKEIAPNPTFIDNPTPTSIDNPTPTSIDNPTPTSHDNPTPTSRDLFAGSTEPRTSTTIFRCKL